MSTCRQPSGIVLFHFIIITVLVHHCVMFHDVGYSRSPWIFEYMDRESKFYECQKIQFINFTEFWKCPLNFILKFSSLILNTITMTLHHSDRNTEQWQARHKSVIFRVRIINRPLLPFTSCFNIVHSLKALFYVHVNNIVLSFTKF